MAKEPPVRSVESELYFRSEAVLAESPLWDDGTLYWTDIPAKTLYSKGDDIHAAQRYYLSCQVGAFALRTGASMILATDSGFQSFDLNTGFLEPWVNPEAPLQANRFNDGKCDPMGRFIAGTLNRKGNKAGALYALEPDRSCRRIYGPVTCSNGLAWSADGTTLYYVDTPSRVVRSFRYDLEHGEVRDEKIVIEVPAEHGKPDGMTIDCEGNLWIALWGGAAVECWSPETGKRLARIELPASQVTSCTFGGNDYQTLFITTARDKLNPGELRVQEKAGSIFCARPAVPGRAAVRFGGRSK